MSCWSFLMLVDLGPHVQWVIDCTGSLSMISKHLLDVVTTAYGAAFVRMFLQEKVDVNGPNTHPVWNYLKGACSTCDGEVPWNFKVRYQA